MPITRRHVLAAAAAICGGRVAAQEEAVLPPPGFRGDREDGWIQVTNPAGKPVLRYVRDRLPEGEKGPAVEGGGFVHPILTPAGAVVSDMAPADHPHHRGVFCGWIQVAGVDVGDWWGWGAKAPKEGRAVVSREARVTDAGPESVTLRLINSWRAGETTVLRERLTLIARAAPGCHVLDFAYKFSTADREPVVISQNPFGGFCYRARPRGALTLSGPGGEITLKDSIFNNAAANWPPEKWYDATYRQADGAVDGVALMDHPSNPLSTWHVVRGLHMLNPCIVAEDAVTIGFGEPLYLRYRLVAHDGAAADVDLSRLYDAFTEAGDE